MLSTRESGCASGTDHFRTWILKFSTCFFTVFRTYWNFNMLFYSFQNILKFSTRFFTVFRTFWNFQHAFLQFSEHTEIFNMLFHSFQNMLKFSTRFFIVLNTLFQYAYNMHYRFQHALKFSTHFQTWKFKTFTVKFYFYVVQIYVNQGSYKLSMTDHYGGQVNIWPHSHTPSRISMQTNYLNEGTRRDITVITPSQKMLMILVNEKGINYYYNYYYYKHSISICLQHALQISEHSEIFNTLSNIKI